MSGVPKDIATMVDQLERSIAEKNFAEVCDGLFTAGASSAPAARSAPRSSAPPPRAFATPRSRFAGST